MKRILAIAIVALLALSLNSCTPKSVSANEEGVLVYQPWIFGHGGVDQQPVSTGMTWIALSTHCELFGITPFTITEDFANMIPADNTPVSFSAYLKVQLKKGRTPELYEKFGTGWYEHSLKATFRTLVRDKACAYKMFDLASKREISSMLETQIYTEIAAYAQKINLPVDIMQVSIGAITPPDQVLTETKLTAAQNQSILTQRARADAELSRKQAEINKAIADQSYKIQMGMTVSEYLHLRQLEIEKEKVELIKDHNNVTVIFGNTSPVVPLQSK